MQVLKEHRTGRFKVCDNYEEAVEFSRTNLNRKSTAETNSNKSVSSDASKENFNSNNSKNVASPLSSTSKNKGDQSIESVGKQFPSLKENLLTQFRRAIESGKLEFVQECVENNPKYLISSCEIPVILFAGNRFNAVHSACRKNKADILRYLLSRISDEQYVNRLFEDRNEFTSRARTEHLLDFYLNTPDKIVSYLFLLYFDKLINFILLIFASFQSLI